MKTIFRSIMIFCAALALYSCSEKYDVYNLPDDRLGFIYSTDSFGGSLTDSVQKFSFVYLSSDIEQDTVWVSMATSGFVADADRSFMLEQVQLAEGDLKNVEGIAFCKLTSRDVVRHPLVQKIVQAYEVFEAKEQNRENKDNSRRRDNAKNKGRK